MEFGILYFIIVWILVYLFFNYTKIGRDLMDKFLDDIDKW